MLVTHFVTRGEPMLASLLKQVLKMVTHYQISYQISISLSIIQLSTINHQLSNTPSKIWAGEYSHNCEALDHNLSNMKHVQKVRNMNKTHMARNERMNKKSVFMRSGGGLGGGGRGEVSKSFSDGLGHGLTATRRTQ